MVANFNNTNISNMHYSNSMIWLDTYEQIAVKFDLTHKQFISREYIICQNVVSKDLSISCMVDCDPCSWAKRDDYPSTIMVLIATHLQHLLSGTTTGIYEWLPSNKAVIGKIIH